VLGGAAAAFLLVGRDGGDGGDTTAGAFTDGAAATVTGGLPSTPAAQATTPANADAPVGPPLLTVGEQRQLTNVGRVEFDLTDRGCPGVKTILQPTAIRAEASGRVAISFTVEVPRVQGVECLVDYAPDGNAAIMVLQTRLPTGRVDQARNTGGSGVAITGAEDIYGEPPVQGEWWWDRGVELNGESLTLLRQPPGSDVPLFRLPLLSR
jgi:hypothetical protein